MIRRLGASFLAITLVLGLQALSYRPVAAQPTLTPEAAQSFLEFYYSGQGTGVVLADAQLCTEITENQCSEPVSPIALQQGETYYLWMMFVVPQGDEVDGIIVQFDHNGITRATGDISVEGSIRWRTWKGFTPNQAGNWEINVFHDLGDDVRTLRQMTVTVNE